MKNEKKEKLKAELRGILRENKQDTIVEILQERSEGSTDKDIKADKRYRTNKPPRGTLSL